MNKRRPPSHAVRNQQRSRDMDRSIKYLSGMITFIQDPKHDLPLGVMEFIIGCVVAVHEKNKRTVGAVPLGINLSKSEDGKSTIVKFIDNHYSLRLLGEKVAAKEPDCVFATFTVSKTIPQEGERPVAGSEVNLQGAIDIANYLNDWTPTLFAPAAAFSEILKTFSKHYLAQDTINPYRLVSSVFGRKEDCEITVTDGDDWIVMEFDNKLVVEKQTKFSTRWLLRKVG